MKKALLLFTCLLLFVFTHAQDDQKKLMDEGIALHDKGDYDGAIAKYEEALKLNPANYGAMYEKSYSLMAQKKYDEAMVLLKTVLKETKDPDYRRLAYVNYGSILDYSGKQKESIELYEKAIKEFPEDYLLHFNKAVTYSGMGESEKAYKEFQQSVTLNPAHASSHNALRQMNAQRNRVASLLSVYTFLLIEPQSKRAEDNVKNLQELIMRGVTKSENGNVNIVISADVLDKKKKKEDDFSTVELMMGLIGGDDKIADSLGAKTDADRLDYKMQLLIGILEEADKKDKGFYKNFYVPMFREMKEKGFVKTASHIALAAGQDQAIIDWLDANKDKVEAFYDWFRAYKWKKE